jgi:uncharacterized repeat protein (TIGR03833 family)
MVKEFEYSRPPLVPFGNNLFYVIMNGQNRENIKPGISVSIVQKQHQRSGELTEGVVADILTNSSNHPHGIKVRLESGEVGRVQIIHE